MLKKMLIVAGLLSLVSVCAQAENTILTNDMTINSAIRDITTEGIRGGAIVNNGHNLTINSNISNNTLIQNDPSTTALGGAIFQESGKLTINNGVTFNNNTVTGGSQTYPDWDSVDGASGGAFYITGDFTVETKGNVTFSNNHAIAVAEGGESNGGAIAAQGSSPDASMTFENVKFTDNSSGTRGGAIYNGDTDITINGKGEFSGNSSKSGGAVYNLDASGNTKFTTGTGTTFTDNKATGNGGAIANFDGTVNVGENNNFSGNTAQTGGAIYNSNWQKTAVTNISGGTTFSNNEASEKGGAIYNSGSVNLDTTAGNINFTNNKSADGADIYLDGENSELIVNGTNKNNKVTFGSEKSIAGDGKIIHQSAGTFEIKDNKDLSGFTGSYTQTSGKTTLNNSTIFNKYDIQKGELELVNGSNATIDGVDKKFSGSALTVDDSTLNLETNVNADVNVNIKENGIINLENNSDLTMNNGDKWDGTINNNNGNLTVDGYKGNGNYTQNGGQITLTNKSDLTLKDKNSSIKTGSVKIDGNSTLNVSNGAKIEGNTNTTVTSGSTVNVNGGVINSTGKTEIQKGANLDINNSGNVTLKSDDVWEGTITLGTADTQNDDSTLTLGMASEEMGILHAESGNLIVQNNNLTIGQDSYIKEEVAIQTSGNIKITDGGYVAINDNDILNKGAQLTLEEGGTLDYGKTEDASALVIGNAGNLNLLSGSILTISNGSNIQDAVALDIQRGAALNLEENLTLNLDSKDKWNGHIYNQNGTINAKGVTDASGSLQQENGALNLSEASKIILNSDSTITGGEIKIEDNSSLTIVNAILSGGDMIIDENSVFTVNSAKDAEFSLNSLTSSGLVNVMNSQLNRGNIESLGIENQANFNIDIMGRSSLRNDSDKFIVGNLTGDGTIRIDDWKLFGDVYGYDAPIDRHVQLGDIFVDKDGNQLQGKIETTDKTNFSPIGWYQLNKGAGAGNYTLDLVKFNPQVFRGQVATVSQWMNQLTIDDMLFTHSMVLPSFKEENGGKMANHYASTDPLFAPYQYSRKDGGIWYKTYGTFEHLQMNNGLKHVGNNAYGSLIGADFGLKDLKNGWKFMPTAYVGYNGAHQYWSDVSQYQNGGQAGFLGTWYKDNFILGAMAYGGVYGNTMDVYGHTDETFNYFAGTAAKASYNIRVHRDFVIQPNLMAAYNYFGQQNWHSNFGQMGMMSGMLHGVNIAPGVNFIWERDTFSAYLTLQYMYNINGASGGRAGNVNLPQLEMERGYIQYGIGFTKKFTDRASGYFQAVLRNVGRTGVGLQAGFLFRLGK